MKKYMVLITWLVIGVGCGRLGEEKPIEVLITTDTTVYSLQDTVHFTLNVINKSVDTVCLLLLNQPPVDILIFKDGKEIWHWRKGCYLVAWKYCLSPQETWVPVPCSLLFWLQVDNNDSLVSRGYYEVIGILDSDPEYRSNSIIIELK
jgi:hypothetical protein